MHLRLRLPIEEFTGELSGALLGRMLVVPTTPSHPHRLEVERLVTRLRGRYLVVRTPGSQRFVGEGSSAGSPSGVEPD